MHTYQTRLLTSSLEAEEVIVTGDSVEAANHTLDELIEQVELPIALTPAEQARQVNALFFCC